MQPLSDINGDSGVPWCSLRLLADPAPLPGFATVRGVNGPVRFLLEI
jgi:hypothetical protein